MARYENGKNNCELKKLTRYPQQGEYFGVFEDQIDGLRVYDEGPSIDYAGLEQFPLSNLKNKENVAHILRYLGNGFCEDIITSKIINLDGSKICLSGYLEELDLEFNLLIERFLECPLSIYQSNYEEGSELDDYDIPLFELNKEFLTSFLENKGKEQEIKERLTEAEKESKKSLLESYKKIIKKFPELIEGKELDVNATIKTAEGPKLNLTPSTSEQ